MPIGQAISLLEWFMSVGAGDFLQVMWITKLGIPAA